MAKFKFRLQSFFDLKGKVEEQRKLEYGKSLARLEKERLIKRQLAEEKERYIDSFRGRIQSQIRPSEFMVYNNYIELLKKRIDEQEKIITIAKKEAEARRLDLVEAMKERKMLETLRENELEAYIIEEKITEQKSLDEIASYQYSKRES